MAPLRALRRREWGPATLLPLPHPPRRRPAMPRMSSRSIAKMPVSTVRLPHHSPLAGVALCHQLPTSRVAAALIWNAVVARRPTPAASKHGRCGLDGLLVDGIAVLPAHQQRALHEKFAIMGLQRSRFAKIGILTFAFLKWNFKHLFLVFHDIRSF